MTSGLKRPCSHPGCPTLIEIGSRCAKHQPSAPDCRRVYDQTTRKSDPALAWAAAVRNSARWQAVRASFRALHPTCCDPFQIHGQFAPLMRVVNHIVPLRVLYSTGQHELAFDHNNLASLCTSCDARIGSMERRNEDTTELFKRAKERECSRL